MTRLSNKLESVLNGMLQRIRRGVNMPATLMLLMAASFIPAHYSFAAGGEEVFNKMCMTCHSLTDVKLVGPGLGGLSDRRDEAWVIKWVKDPQGMVNSGDEYAVKLFDEYNKVPMPGFPQLTDEEISGIYEFVKSKGAASASAGGATENASGGTAATTDNTAAAAGGTKPLNTKMLWWALLALSLVGLWFYRFKRKTLKIVREAGYHGEPHAIPNYGFYFFMFLVCAAIIGYVLVALLENNTGMINTLMFIVLPYLSLGIFLVGSIYRYMNRGYQVSSLSSQFLEGRKLFWGSQPFHWGLLILFGGHLIAFLFPKAVLAWNGEPVRLLILEFSSFAFGLSALLGLILLVKRRLSAKTLLVVTNKMDMVVYTVLFTQIITGLGVAFFVRWGSSWFSSVLTPYLRSVFSFDPDINAVAEMPWLIQLHIVSAFLIIGIIPFTRFMHFLVAPVDYIWRRYQLVIWNWNPKNIRQSGRHNYGKRPRNH